MECISRKSLSIYPLILISLPPLGDVGYTWRSLAQSQLIVGAKKKVYTVPREIRMYGFPAFESDAVRVPELIIIATVGNVPVTLILNFENN